ncbi:MAG: hypothetical protein ACI9HK_001736, partial [Pirellulaceae bacterium]
KETFFVTGVSGGRGFEVQSCSASSIRVALTHSRLSLREIAFFLYRYGLVKLTALESTASHLV